MAYPGLNRDPAYWHFLEYLLYGTTVDRETRQLIISQDILATIESKLDLLKWRKYNGRDFLNRFSRDVFPVKASPYNFEEGRARRVELIGIRQDIWDLVTADLNGKWTQANRVYFATGQAFTKKVQREMTEDDRIHALEQMAEAGCKEARDLLKQLNLQPPHRFTKVIDRHWDAAMVEVGKIENEVVAIQQMRILRFIRSSPIPFYKPVGKSVRIFPLVTSIVSLKREVREILTQDWTGFDLRSAQLAIIGHDWDIPSLQAVLKAGSFWNLMFEYFDQEKDENLKGIIKKGLYTFVFGAEEKTMIAAMVEEGGTEEMARHFLQHPLIQDMWAVRERRLAEIRKESGAKDCFDRWITIPLKWNKKTNRNLPNPRSVLAQLAQARELQLLYPVVELASTTDEFTIMLWLHDGFSVDFKDKSKKRRWIERITKVVNDRATELGIHTQLELKG